MIIDCKPTSGPGGKIKDGCWEYYRCKDYLLPESGHVLAPWVAIDFIDKFSGDASEASITVSNHSSTSTNPKHSAVIKSFSFGHSDGSRVNVVIHDTQGGCFESFMKHLTKDWVCLKENLNAIYMRFQFGWVKSGCTVPYPRASSPCYFVTVDAVETNFTEGKFVFDITGHDICVRMFEGATEFERGGEGKESVYFMDAAREYMTKHQGPNVGSVDFKREDEGGKILSSNAGDKIFHSPTGDPIEEIKGPKGKWVSHGRDKLHTMRAWASTCPSYQKKRSWRPNYNSTIEKGEVVFWEVPDPDCFIQNWCPRSLGTYIVNGGPSSPVIEFNPKIRWQFGGNVSTGGQSGDHKMKPLTPEGSKNPGHKCLPREEMDGAGHVTETFPSDWQLDAFSGLAVKEDSTNDHNDKRAIKIDQYDRIAADLVVVGDPTFCPPTEAIGRVVSIVLINPFFIIPNGEKCGEWLSGPPCNPILSNNAWEVMGVNHSIEAGKYVTTINVHLVTPGVDVSRGTPWGATAVGWKPPTC